MSKRIDEIMDILLKQYDWSIRCVDDDLHPYYCGYADGTGQIILDISKLFNDPKQFEAYKRVMAFESVEQYKKAYPKPKNPLQEPIK